ncbi:MAG TPA: class I SAM-dependent methyltransferase [Rhizobacter sp.]|nr:class I SAM-dependent methyltransferase [Rhizobacter sp.]
MTEHATADSMQRYYARRAAEYERIYTKPERQADIAAVKAWLPMQFEACEVLEVACGTGYWTPHAAARCASWLGTDVNDEVLALARGKLQPHGRVAFQQADAYALALPRRFNAAFAGFWWSHVPLQRTGEWLDGLHACLQPGARVLLIDNLYVEGSSQPITRRDAQGNGYQMRRLDDGSQHEVLKNFPDEAQMRALLGARATALQWVQWQYFWACAYTV